MAETIDAVQHAPGRRWRSASTMSRLAGLVDGAHPGDRAATSNTFLSYYTWGAGIALALDLSLRDRTNGVSGLDDFMRALWDRFGAPPAPAPGLVARPYDRDELVATLAAVAGDREFATGFFARYVDGREVPDYASLLQRAGLLLRRAREAQPWAGPLALDHAGHGALVRELPQDGTPAAAAGLAQDDVIVRLDDETIGSPADWRRALERHRPGDAVPVGVERRGRAVSLSLRIGEDPEVEIVPVERAGGRLTPAEDAFRRAWLASKVTPVQPR
jgi:predicted metalloprotease with PDZ domain